MLGKLPLSVKSRNTKITQEFWLADNLDPCSIRLDLLTCWGAMVNTSRNTIHLKTLACIDDALDQIAGSRGFSSLEMQSSYL